MTARSATLSASTHSWRVLATVALAVVAVGGCTQASPGAAPGTPTSVPGPAAQGETPTTPDAELAPADLAAMLRLPATATSSSTSCGPEAVTVSLTFTDAAMGHRFGVLEVVNASSEACSVRGYPGIGARGGWGSTFQLTADSEPIAHPVSRESADIGEPDTGIDIGMMTTVRIGPLRADGAEA